MVFHGSINEDYAWEVALFRLIREFKDGITFFNLDINWDRYLADHTPRFEVRLVVLNCMLLEASLYYKHHRDQ